MFSRCEPGLRVGLDRLCRRSIADNLSDQIHLALGWRDHGADRDLKFARDVTAFCANFGSTTRCSALFDVMLPVDYAARGTDNI